MANAYDNYLIIDFETFSDVPIADGLDKYFASPNFKVLLMAVSYKSMKAVYDFKELEDIESINLPDQTTPLVDLLRGPPIQIVAHNAMFEQLCLQKLLGFDLPAISFVDTAVLARANGYSSSLDAVSKQLHMLGKTDSTIDLMKLFCFPSKQNDFMQEFDESLPDKHPSEWSELVDYASHDITMTVNLQQILYLDPFSDNRPYSYNGLIANDAVTRDMNLKGWPVDLELLDIFSTQADKQVKKIKADAYKTGLDINFNSPKQIMEYCAKRKVSLRSTNITTVTAAQHQLKKALADKTAKSFEQEEGWREVLAVLDVVAKLSKTTSLAKLSKIKDQVGADARLRHQYMHFGASQTGRTTGVDVQLQNLTRMAAEPLDVEELKATYSKDTSIDIDTLSANMRQLFRSSHEDGKLIVGDFNSIESRGLAWLAGENWKLKAYFDKRPIYKELASSFFSIPVDVVQPDQRTFGKLGELSCGYGSGPPAVVDFAAKMGIQLSLQDATMIVNNWRSTCADTVAFGLQLQEALYKCISQRTTVTVSKHNTIGNGFKEVVFQWQLQTYPQQPDAYGRVNVSIVTYNPITRQLMNITRVFHGAHLEGSKIFYLKPSSTKTGPPWIKDAYIPGKKIRKPFSLYGGKLLGILTQSMCYEIFMIALYNLAITAKTIPNIDIIGQFHDEIVLDWWPSDKPGAVTEAQAKTLLAEKMSTSPLVGFPMDCEIKAAHTYIK